MTARSPNNYDDDRDEETQDNNNNTDVNIIGSSGKTTNTALEIQKLRSMIESLQQEVSMLKRSAKTQRDFVVAQYNILAGYLGDNRQPWFLYGIPMDPDRRRAILNKFYERDADTGKYKNVGWPKYVRGLLSGDEMERVERVHSEYFVWEKRKHRIIDQIKDLDADLLSLVECDNYDDFFKIQMYHLGYGCIYKQRPRKRSKDGCAIFYRHGVFTLEVWKGVEFIEEPTAAAAAAATKTQQQEQQLPPSSGACTAATTGATNNNKKINKDRVALIALLQHFSGRKVIFISTHLARNPEDPKKTTIRICQVAQLLYHLTKFAVQYDAMNVPVILAGDMNATNIRQVAGVARIVFELACEAAHPFIYTPFSPRSLPTSVTSSRKMKIDYLLLQSRHLEIIDTYEMARIGSNDPIPNKKHPSDHIPLVFRVGFKKHSLMMQEFAKAWIITVLCANNERKPTVATLQPEMLFMHHEELCKAFNVFDVDDSGEISVHDLSMCLNELRMTEYFRDILNVIDKQLRDNHDGTEQEEENKERGGEEGEITMNGQYHLQQQQQGGGGQRPKMRRRETLQSTFCSLTMYRSFNDDNILTTAGSNDRNNDSHNNNKEEPASPFSSPRQQRASSSAINIKLTFEMFVEIYTKCVLSQKNYFRDNLLVTDTIYNYFDVNRSGELEFDELYSAFSNACPFELSRETFNEIFQKLDHDQNGTVSMDELFDYLVKNHCLQQYCDSASATTTTSAATNATSADNNNNDN